LEGGVWRGGAIVLMCAMVNAYDMDRTVIAADSFSGIPHSDWIEDDPVDKWPDRWEASVEEVKATIARYALLDERVRFVCGRFKDALPSAGIGMLALVRLDADSYESTSEALEILYPKLSPGGVIIIDDCRLPGCAVAVAEYRTKHSIMSPLFDVGMNVYWFKPDDDGRLHE